MLDLLVALVGARLSAPASPDSARTAPEWTTLRIIIIIIIVGSTRCSLRYTDFPFGVLHSEGLQTHQLWPSMARGSRMPSDGTARCPTREQLSVDRSLAIDHFAGERPQFWRAIFFESFRICFRLSSNAAILCPSPPHLLYASQLVYTGHCVCHIGCHRMRLVLCHALATHWPRSTGPVCSLPAHSWNIRRHWPMGGATVRC